LFGPRFFFSELAGSLRVGHDHKLLDL